MAAENRILARVVVDDGCWKWTGHHDRDGYARCYWNGRALAHRAVYEILKGPIPQGLEIDHLCRNRGCVNPAHMEPVTHAENTLRGFSPQALNARKTECAHGHPLSGENLHIRPRDGGRICRACDRRRHREAYQRRKAS